MYKTNERMYQMIGKNNEILEIAFKVRYLKGYFLQGLINNR